MSEIKTYPEMNETVKDLLRRSEEPMNLYILARIEELEKADTYGVSWRAYSHEPEESQGEENNGP